MYTEREEAIVRACRFVALYRNDLAGSADAFRRNVLALAEVYVLEQAVGATGPPNELELRAAEQGRIEQQVAILRSPERGADLG